jgi:hypothetical protein
VSASSLFACLLLPFLVCAGWAQDTSSSSPPPSTAPPASTPPTPGKASQLQNVLLLQADPDIELIYLKSRVGIEYAFTQYYNNGTSNKLKLKGLQGLGHNYRFGLGYEVPYSFVQGGGPLDRSANGIADFKLGFGGYISKSERFGQGVAIKVTFQTAYNSRLGGSNTVLEPYYSCTLPLGGRMLLTGTLTYGKAIRTRPGARPVSQIEPELAVSRTLGKRVAAYIDWDSYYSFTFDEFGQKLKAGLGVSLDAKNRWSLSPYVEFPLNNFTTRTNEKRAAAVSLKFYY